MYTSTYDVPDFSALLNWKEVGVACGTMHPAALPWTTLGCWCMSRCPMASRVLGLPCFSDYIVLYSVYTISVKRKKQNTALISFMKTQQKEKNNMRSETPRTVLSTLNFQSSFFLQWDNSIIYTCNYFWVFSLDCIIGCSCPSYMCRRQNKTCTLLC